MNRGKFYVFEGIDGSGKSTQSRLLAKHLESQGHQVHLTREPTDNFVGKSIRMVLEKKQVLPHESLAALFLADRYDHILGAQGMLKMIEDGIHVICDRYYWSSFAYHSLDLDMDFLIEIHRGVIELLSPDKTFFLDILPADSVARIAKRSDQRDLFEKESILTSVRENYLTAFQKLDHTSVEVLSAMGSPESIHAAILDLL